MKIAVVIPAWQEEIHIKTVVEGVKKIPEVNTVYVVDDGSTDKTAQLATEAGAVAIRQPQNMGVGAALRTGYLQAQQDGADIVVTMGGDDQDMPEQIPRVLQPILEQDYDLVQGSRWLAGGATIDIPLFRRITTKTYAIVLRLASGFPFTDGTNGFRAFRTNLVSKINLNQEWLNHYELEPYILYNAVKLGLKVKEVPVTKRYHIKRGYSKMVPLLDWWRILRPIIFLRLGIKK